MKQLTRQREGMRKWAVVADGRWWRRLTCGEEKEKWLLRFEQIEQLRQWIRDGNRITTKMWDKLHVRGLRMEHYVDVDGTFYSPGELGEHGAMNGQGAVVVSPSARVQLVIAPRVRRGRKRRAAVIAARERRGAAMRGVWAGDEADDGDRWAVEQLLDVRRPKLRRGRQLEVRVAWVSRGVVESVRWRPSWTPVGWLSADLRREARRMEGVKYGSGSTSRRMSARFNAVQRQSRSRERQAQQWAARLRTTSGRKRKLDEATEDETDS